MSIGKFSSLLCLILAASILGSCGGDDNGTGPETDSTPPAVISTFPSDGAVQVPLNAVITASFSEKINPASLTPASFFVSPGVTGTLSYADSTAVFTPDADLDSAVHFTAIITTGIRDKAGNAMASDFSWTFRAVLDSATADLEPPQITLSRPQDGAIVGDTLTIQADATDNIGVSRVEIFIDHTLVVPGGDVAAPYEYAWDLSALEIAGEHTVYAVAFDTAGNSTSTDTVLVSHLWRLLATDGDEPHARDIKNVWVRSSDETLEFRVETNGNWADYRSATEGIDVAFFFDVDRDRLTGDTAVFGQTILINDIGAEYRVVIGNHGDSLARYNGLLSSWQSIHGPSGFAYRSIANDTNIFEIGIYRSQMTDLEDSLDIVTANVLLPSTWDWAPNQGHVTYYLNTPRLFAPEQPAISGFTSEPEPLSPAPRNPLD
ncbi:MAG TPA: Ig-like domain-containing protein [Acidobacteriota bacterium]|nr:Ig-like domain-containing protein [Acidobacteriota bacterium]